MQLITILFQAILFLASCLSKPPKTPAGTQDAEIIDYEKTLVVPSRYK